MEGENEICHKRIKYSSSAADLKRCITGAKEPFILKNVLSWDLLKWSLHDWVEQLENPTLDVRKGTTQCAKTPQWESNCEMVSTSLKDLLNGSNTNNTLDGTWKYFGYKHIKQYFGKKSELLKLISWADFGFPDKNGNDSTIWMGTKGAYTPCHMDSYGCNIVGQVYGRKQWIMFPPSATSSLRPTRVPYEESSIYSNIHFTCGLNVPDGIGEAHVAELSPGDVLIVPKHWWHYVENLSTGISINMWIPKESDHSSRLEESLARYFVGTTLNNLSVEDSTPLLNPNEMDLLDEPIDLRQISWCLQQAINHSEPCKETDEFFFDQQANISVVPSVSARDLQNMLLTKCGCDKENAKFPEIRKDLTLSEEDVINAFCHPEVIAKVAQVLISSKHI